MELADRPRYFVGGQLYDEMVMLICSRCSRSGQTRVLGRVLTRDGLAHFQRYMSVRHSRAVVGYPEGHRAANGRETIRHSFVWMEVDGKGLHFKCSVCNAEPSVNAFELAQVVGDAITRCPEPGLGLPVLIDPWGGATVGD
ncbi:MAG: hypothetical protein ABSD85_14475 [Acidimicrobiales bacterium]